MQTLNKSEVIEQLAAECRISVAESDRIMRKFVNLIYTTLAAGGKVNISGFGQFSVSHRESRLGVNPRQPDQKITIPELNTPKFKAGEAFKAAVKLK